MLRVIIRRDFKCSFTGLKSKTYSFIDIENEKVEEILRTGGADDKGYDFSKVVSVEVFHTKEQ